MIVANADEFWSRIQRITRAERLEEIIGDIYIITGLKQKFRFYS